MAVANLFVPYLTPGEFAALVEGIAGKSGVKSWWTEQPLGGQSAVVALARVEGPQDIELALMLSEACGGFCVTRQSESGSPLVFNSGYRLRGEPADTWESCFEQLCGLAWDDDNADVNGLPRFNIAMPAPKAEEAWTRAAFANVTGAALGRAAAQARAVGLNIEGWRCLQRTTPLAGLPFVVLEKRGECDVALAHFLAKRLDAYGAAVEMSPGLDAACWWFDPAGDVKSEEGSGAAEVMGTWYGLAITMGEAAGLIRWPGREHGRALGEVADESDGTQVSPAID